MAGNIVKWWRQFKQYKQFSVLHECPTDSEELIYQTPTPLTDPPISNYQKSLKAQTLQQQSQQQSTVLSAAPSTSSDTTTASSQPQVQPTVQPKTTSTKVIKAKEQQMKEKMSQEQLERLQKRHSIATTRHLEKIEEHRMKVDEITCDISAVPDPGKKPQPIQFSFTLYDVDGHGKITKDDIAGIVSTIYDSLGKSVVVPHYGKKTINVKLTVSPDAKQQQQKALQSHEQQLLRANNKKHQLATRRRGYRLRALPSDEDDEERSESNSDNLAPLPNQTQTEIIHNSTKACENNLNNQQTNNSTSNHNNNNNVYESINNLKVCNQTCTLDNLMTAKNNKNIEIYKNCQPSHSPERLHIDEVDSATKPQAKKKLLKKTRSRRPRALETRGRSLSVGNEHKWRKPEQIPVDLVNESNLNNNNNSNNTSIRRDELIEIIKDSMEKNRLCFQGNRKSENINSTNQIRQRSNTVTCTNKVSVSNNTGSNNCNGEADQQHLCAFDSVLHATICQHSTTVVDPTKISKINNRQKMKQMNQSMPPALKLKSSVLNQLNPNLTPEQKLSRKLNDVEKWLLDDKNLHNPNAVDKLSPNVTSTPKKVFNKEVLISKKSKSHSKQQKDVLNASKNQIILEYLSDCENLLLSEDEQQNSKTQTAIPTVDNKTTEVNPESGSNDSSLRFVHIHHHFYHFNQNECH